MAIAWLQKKRARRGWAALIVVYGIVASYLFVDLERIFYLSEGYGPADYDWAVWSGDFPGVWTRLERSDVFARAAEDAPEINHQFSLFLRHASGMRWTPARWRLWFGRPAVVAGIDDDVALAVHAKLPVRMMFAAARALGFGNPEHESLRINEMHVGLKNGALLVATSPEALTKLRSEGGAWSSMGDAGIQFVQVRPERFDATIDFEKEINLSFWFGNVVPRAAAAREQYFAIDWPESPIVSVQSRGQRWDIESEVVSEWWSKFPAHTEIDTAWENFEALLPEGWRTGTDNVQFALFDVDTSETIPIPDAAVYARSETPLAPLTPPVNAIPYEWSGAAGWMTPWKGEGANLFVVANERARVFANEEATMAALMARERAGRVSSEDARIEVDAPRLAKVLIDLARTAGENELWPEMNAADVEREVVPWLRALGALGEIRLEGKYENGPLVFRGGTHAPEEAAEPSRTAE